MIMQTPMTTPMMIESLRRRDLIINTKLLTPGMVSSRPLDTWGESVEVVDYSRHSPSVYQCPPKSFVAVKILSEFRMPGWKRGCH